MIDLKDIEIRYGDFTAVKDINIHVDRGEFFTFLGPSGCGKTTTLRAIAGFINPYKGRVIVDGEDITDMPVEKREIGMVFQSYALFPTMTVYDNIAYGLRVENMDKGKIDERVDELADLVKLDRSQLDKNVSALSGGQQQRVAIARALAKKPEIVLFDEPLSNLDAKLRKQLRQELKAIQRETGMTAIYVTHDQEEALEMSDKIAVFNDGYIEQIGSPREIYDESATEFICTFVGDPNKLNKEFIQYVNSNNSQYMFDLNKVHYIRPEKILLKKHDKSEKLVEFSGRIIKEAFQGSYSRYLADTLGNDLVIMIKNDINAGIRPNADAEQKFYIYPGDILEYEVSN